MAKLQTSLLAILTAIMLVVGCSKSVEGESKAWESNTKKVETLMAQYPGMKPALEARMSAAKTTWDEASGMSGDAQVDKMAKANSQLMADFVRDLDGLDEQLDKLRKSKVEAAAKAGDESSRLAAKVAAEDAQKTVERVEGTLKTGAKDEASARAVMDKIKADIKTAQAGVDKVMSVDKEKSDQKADDDKAATDKAAADKAAEEAKVADWTCEYCSNINKHDAATCTGCGAPRPSEAEKK